MLYWKQDIQKYILGPRPFHLHWSGYCFSSDLADVCV